MILVSGAKRTGTSLMMQLLEKAGFNVLGEKFPALWKGRNSHKNKEGYYESKFVDEGVRFSNCPFTPLGAELHAVKVFAHAISETDSQYIFKIILMVRDWREQEESYQRLLQTNKGPEVNYKPGYYYFYEYNEFFATLMRRNLPTIVVDYNDLLTNTKVNLGNLRGFLGVGRFDVASKQIKKKLKTVQENKTKYDNIPFHNFLDRYYQAIKAGHIPASLNQEVNQWREIVYEYIQKVNNEKAAREKAAAVKE